MKKIFAFTMLLICLMLCPSALAETYSGDCGPDGSGSVKWELNTDTGLLRVYGSGPMGSLSLSSADKNIYGKHLTSVVVEEGVTTVSAYAFSGLNMKTATLPNGLTAIGLGAFEHCPDLEKIILPASLNMIDNNAFYGSGLKSIELPSGVRLGIQVFMYCSSLENVVLNDGLTEIPYRTFYGCGLKKLNLPDSVEKIGEAAFQQCLLLEEAELPKGLKTLGPLAFQGTDIKEIRIPEGVTELPGGEFAGCSSLEKVYLPQSLRAIGSSDENFSGTFAGCRSLTELSVPEGVTEIGYSAFRESGLTKINLPNSLTKIGKAAFSGSKLTSIVIPDSVTEIGEKIFYYCHELTGVTLPNGLLLLPDETFAYCNNLRELKLPEGLVSIGNRAIYICNELRELYIPKSVTYISPNFSGGFSAIKVSPENPCYFDDGGVLYSRSGPTLLHYPEYKTAEEYAIPEGVTGVLNSSFEYAENLKKLTLPASIYIPFAEMEANFCCGPAEYVVAEENPYFTAVDGVLFSRDKSVLIRYPSGRENESYTVPYGTNELAPHCFRYSKNLKEVILPESVTVLGSRAFNGSGLERITIPSGALELPRDLFQFCDSLKTIKFPDGLREFNGFNSGIGPVILDFPPSLAAIKGYILSAVRTVTLPDNISYIGRSLDLEKLVLLCRPGSLTERRLRNEGIPCYSTLISPGETPEVVASVSVACTALLNGNLLPVWRLRNSYFISERDLTACGYSFDWDPDTRITTITAPESTVWTLNRYEAPAEPKSADIWSSDVRFVINGTVIPSLNIGGGESIIDINALTGSIIY
ncbi:MAG: leucine-rich repeat domain-containing protein [Oscillospiraceae bacterium]|nr:leucine-rich repeat domain-containing protein [Oscillospiraceae bacterium]